MSDLGRRPRSARTTLPDPEAASNVTYNPSQERLRELAREGETTTEFGSPSYVSDHRSRAADRTRNTVDHEFGPGDYDYLDTALDRARDAEMVCLDRRLGRHPEHTYCCRYYVPKRYARIGLALSKLLEPAPSDAEPDFLTVQIPDYEETAIRVFPEKGLTAVLGSDYTGEAKKSYLRLFMYHAKEAGGLGLHAGSKRVTLRDDDGGTRDVGQAFLGLSATGKSTLTAHGLRLEDPEEATMLQDDVCALLADGSVVGSEGSGLYAKTHGLDHEEQPALYEGVTHESALLENVDVEPDGTVDFDSDEYTANGRAVVSRDQVCSAADDIDLDRIDQVFFITRNPLMPPVAKLSITEAAVAFMLGESIQTSAGDPSAAGEAIRVVGTNPFIIGSEGVEGNRFHELVDSVGVDCYVLNTGQLGDGAKDVTVEDSVTLLREIARGTVTWRTDDASGLTVPQSVPGLDVDAFDVAAHVDDYQRKLRELRADRREYLDRFAELDDEIVDSVY